MSNVIYHIGGDYTIDIETKNGKTIYRLGGAGNFARNLRLENITNLIVPPSLMKHPKISKAISSSHLTEGFEQKFNYYRQYIIDKNADGKTETLIVKSDEQNTHYPNSIELSLEENSLFEEFVCLEQHFKDETSVLRTLIYFLKRDKTRFYFIDFRHKEVLFDILTELRNIDLLEPFLLKNNVFLKCNEHVDIDLNSLIKKVLELDRSINIEEIYNLVFVKTSEKSKAEAGVFQKGSDLYWIHSEVLTPVLSRYVRCTVGAGDTFWGNFVDVIARERDLEQAISIGLLAAQIVISQEGVTVSPISSSYINKKQNIKISPRVYQEKKEFLKQCKT